MMFIMSLEVLTDLATTAANENTVAVERVVQIFTWDAYACEEDRRSDPEAIRINGEIIQRYVRPGISKNNNAIERGLGLIRENH